MFLSLLTKYYNIKIKLILVKIIQKSYLYIYTKSVYKKYVTRDHWDG